ncbi:FHA domain-containing protein [Psychrobacter sp. I-STPA10]|uniref:FHA domain-containing protein n=1 Tax=Psychrobacter sp. I-STPA10 TaxID=2585769 RepID=UPI001E36557F|nr:FHA domain-containing protein [Psychrobacter sp. I-STPA10]
MINKLSDKNNSQWQLNAVSEALGDLSLTINDSLTVGRGSDNDLVLGSKQVSREHAKLYVVNGQLYIKDLASSNGTYINDVALTAHKSTNIKADDMVAFANFQFQAKKPTVAAKTTTSKPDADDTKPQVADTQVMDTNTKADDDIHTTKVSTDDSKPTVTDVDTTAQPQPTVSSDKPVTPVNPIVDEIKPEVSDLQEPSAAQPTTDIQVEATQDTISQKQDKDTAAKNIDSESITSTEQNPQAANTKIEAPVNPLDTSLENNFDKQSGSSVGNVESNETAQIEKPTEDKTTQTTLQQEADPDVLRAKQAATGQFAPAENNDIGTNDNKAIDQAATNPATHPEQRDNKKASGGWFIWVFLLIIIIAIGIWMMSGGQTA